MPTASPGWIVADQVAHLAYFDASAAVAILEPERFQAGLTELYEGVVAHGIDEFTLGPLRALRTMTTARNLAPKPRRRWLRRPAPTADDRVAWYGPAMGAVSFLTSRLMETWAHGVDVAEALGSPIDPRATASARRALGFMTRSWSYRCAAKKSPRARSVVLLTSPGRTLDLG